MGLVLKLAVLGAIVLMPKTHLYLSSADLSKTQTAAYERPISGPAAHRDDPNSRGYVALIAGGKQPEISSCSANPGLEGNDTMAVHATDTSPKGSHG
jgi:hypothetical protein